MSTLNKLKRLLFLYSTAMILFFASSCASLTGGTTYRAKVVALDHPHALIKVNGETKGIGHATFNWQRSRADQLSISLSEEGCEEQITSFDTKVFRLMPFLGNLIIPGVGIIGIIVDLATQSIWQPNTYDSGVYRIDSKTFLYEIEYYACPSKKEEDVTM